MEKKKNIKCWHFIFQISNGLNMIYSLFLIGIFSYFVANNNFKDSFTISFIIIFIFYAFVCVIGYLWTKKSLCINYIYSIFLFGIYFIILFFEWTIIIDVDSLITFIISIFKNSEKSAYCLYDIIINDYDNYVIGGLVNSLFFVI